MIIKQKYITKAENHLALIKKDDWIVVGVRNIGRFGKILEKIGFSKQVEAGEVVLPSAKFGRFSRFNANGKNIIRKDLPKETHYRTAEWHWEQWIGRGETETKTKIVEIPYQRYPRQFIKPPSVELTIAIDKADTKIIVAPKIKYQAKNSFTITHLINLFLEIFGECEILQENLEQTFKAPVKRLNWEILPKGNLLWESLQRQLEPIIREAPKGNRPVISYRFETVNAYKPEFVAIGQGGFRGYVIFAFPKKKIYILENLQINNATYVFGDDWQTLSKMTKAEILSDELQKDRLIHRNGWHKKVDKLLT